MTTIADDMDELALRVEYHNFLNGPDWKLMSFEEFKAMKAKDALRQRRDALHREVMAFEDDPENMRDSKKWHEGVQRYSEQIRLLDYQIKMAGAA